MCSNNWWDCEHNRNTDTWQVLFGPDLDVLYIKFYEPDFNQFNNYPTGELYSKKVVSSYDGKNLYMIELPWGNPNKEPQNERKRMESILLNTNRVFLRIQNVDFNGVGIRGSYQYFSVPYTNPYYPSIVLPAPFFE